MEQATKPWWRRWWGITLIVLAVYFLWRFTIAPAPFTFGQSSVPAGDPWTVTLSGTPNTPWDGGCQLYTSTGTLLHNATVTAPWTAHYSAQDNSVDCYFENQASSGSGALIIRYNGQIVASTNISGGYGVLSTVADAP